MKIVDRKTFLALPGEVLFSKYEPCFFGPLEIRGDVWAHCNDFLSRQVADAIECAGSNDFSNKLEDAEISGVSLPMDFEICGRDGCFDADQLFAVWEREDVLKLIDRLARLVKPPV
jgi:hypothetical protein